jgi:hypothetical protein
MEMKKKLILILLILTLISSTFFARDFFVRSGSAGDGSRDNPFADPWQALRVAKQQDVIHITEGTYNGLLGSGSFKLEVSDCTLLGGYNADFTKRDPFQFFTVLEQVRNYKGANGNEPILTIENTGKTGTNAVIDGFVLNGQTKNTYDASGQIILTRGDLYPLLEVRMPNTKIRNCVILNHSWEGIHGNWSGNDNEISNCFIINTYYTTLSAETSKPDSIIRIKNNTFAFTWRRYASGLGIQIRKNLTAIIENNVFMYIQGVAVDNLNPTTQLENNVFFQCQDGFYQGRDETANRLIWRPEDFRTLAENPDLFLLKQANKNTVTDTGIRPDPEYFKNFSDIFSLDTEKLDMEKLNELRRQMGYSLETAPPSKNITGLAYKLSAVTPALVYKGGQGAQLLQ